MITTCDMCDKTFDDRENVCGLCPDCGDAQDEDHDIRCNCIDCDV